jgi:glycosyltransferase involved in cell wall biosynthesis
MRIGILPSVDPSTGGIYQYSWNMLRALHEWKEVGCEDEFLIFTAVSLYPALASLNGRNWTVKSLALLKPPSLREQMLDGLRRLAGEGPHREAWRWFRRATQRYQTALSDLDMVVSRPDITRQFRDSGVELCIYPYPQSLSFETEVPYVMAVHDLQHRLQPEFPEVSANGEWESREHLFRNGTRYATLLLADSEVGKEDILNFYGPYGVTPDRVKVLPFLPASYLVQDVSESERLRVRTMHKLPERYLFYPAQFWPHKNHCRIVQALGLIKEVHGVEIGVVFCGSHTGEIRERTFREMMSLSRRLGIEKDIHCLGYVSDQDMSGIYAEAVALVMPTFFGPTNIPILEAWSFGCPVLSSDIRGIRGQVEDGGLLVDPRSIESIADGIYRLWTNDTLCQTLAERGRRRLATYTPAEYQQRLIQILEEAKMSVRTKTQRFSVALVGKVE